MESTEGTTNESPPGGAPPGNSQRGRVEVDGVTRSFGQVEVLKGISIDVKPGQIVGLLGPSGAGKTTLVRMIAGADIPDTGEVRIGGEAMPKLSLLPRIGYMAQSDALYMELSGRENLQFFGSLYGLEGQKLNNRINDVGSLVDLQDALGRPVETYSGGMKRRLSLAIALLHEPEVLVLDEPTVGIDPVLRQSLWSELLGYARRGSSLLITTHVMDEAEKCDLVCMLRDGRLIAVDSPDGLKQSASAETMEQAFLHYGGAS